MEKVLGVRSIAHYDGEMYDVIAIHRYNVYEFYIAPSDGKYPLLFMYAVMDSENVEILMENALKNVPEYVELFRDTEWN